MNVQRLLDLQTLHGTNVVWQDGDKWTVAFGDDVMESDFDEEWTDEEKGVDFFVAYGDDMPNAIELIDLDKVSTRVWTFVEDYIGVSCY